MKVKVCGMRQPENIRQVERAGADWIGFICYSKSPRFVGENAIPPTPNAKRVGVFVNADFPEIMGYASRLNLHIIQLHGHESPCLCKQLRAEGFQVMKAFQAKTSDWDAETEPYAPCCDYFLFDTPCAGYGGSGQSFQWDLLSGYHGDTPFFLSGGLRPESLEALQAFSHPQWVGIDLNSGFEVSPGLKDAALLQSFITQFKTTTL